MADKQRISCDSMKKDAQNLEVALKNIPQMMEAMRVSMRKLANCWEGPAWEAFQIQVNKDIKQMDELYEVVIKLQENLGQGRDIYLDTETKVNLLFRTLWI